MLVGSRAQTDEHFVSTNSRLNFNETSWCIVVEHADQPPDPFIASTSFLPSSLTGTPFFVGASDVSATGWGETSLVAFASLPERGHEKLSARPAGATKAAPRLTTFAAIGSGVVCVVWPCAPTRSPRSPLPMESGSTGPTSGLAPAVPDIGVVSALGSATGTTWLDITRRRSRST